MLDAVATRLLQVALPATSFQVQHVPTRTSPVLPMSYTLHSIPLPSRAEIMIETRSMSSNSWAEL